MVFGTDVAGYINEFGGFHNQYGPKASAPGAIPVYLSAQDGCSKASTNVSKSGDYCPIDVDMNGDPHTGAAAGKEIPLCDFITYTDAKKKLQFAKENLLQKAQPFFMITGIRKPHLLWRAPAGYVAGTLCCVTNTRASDVYQTN